MEPDSTPQLSFYWYLTPDDFDEEGNVTLNLTSGRLRHKWVPIYKTSAQRYLKYHEDALGLREANDDYFLVKFYLEDLEDISSKHKGSIPAGHEKSGIVIKTPLKITVGKKEYVENEEGEKVEILPYYTTGRLDVISSYKGGDISAIEMGIYSDEEIEKLAVMEVTMNEVLRQDGTPIIDGLLDPRMGSVKTDVPCSTCHKTLDLKSSNVKDSCEGHFGYIHLPVPIPKYLYLGSVSGKAVNTHPTMNTINNVCHHCSRIMLPDDILSFITPKIEQEFEIGGRHRGSYERIKEMMGKFFAKYKQKNGRNCPHCNKYSSSITFYHSSGEFVVNEVREDYFDYMKILSYSQGRSILRNILDEDCKFLGMDYTKARPENLFFEYLPVIPNTARPMRIRSTGEIEEDDLTKLYQDVIWSCNQLRTIMQGRGITSEARQITYLYHAISRITNNKDNTILSGGSTQVYGYEGSVALESYKGILNRFAGKKGRFRINLQSKYVENVSYSVVSPDPNFAIDEIGIPMKVCMKTTFPMKITKENIKEIEQYLQNALTNTYPRATYLIDDGDEFSSDASSRRGLFKDTGEPRINVIEDAMEDLEIGKYIYRDLIKGDIALFNRAPSLHRQSVLAFRIRPVPTKSIRMNPTVCIPFNADYDGDAMKVHFLQSEAAAEEAKKWMLLSKSIIHARYGKLTVATDQDQTSGLYLYTHTNKARRNEWNNSGLGFTDEGVPYLSKDLAISCYSTVFSENRETGEIRTINSLPESDYKTPNGEPAYTGRALFSHLFDTLDANYVSATFNSNSPEVDEEGNISRDEKEKKIKDRVTILNGKLLHGTLEKEAFGEGGSSIAPSFIYHEGYEKGQEKLSEFIELVTRFGLSAHRTVGYTMGLTDISTAGLSEKIDIIYNKYAEKILEVDLAFSRGKLREYVMKHEPEKVVWADSDPLQYVERRVATLSEQFDSELLIPIEDMQGSGNSMQISVRSKARGSDENVRQMAGSYGMTRVGGRRLTVGINPDRPLAHYPRKDSPDYERLHPKYSGFIKESYAKGMEPTEYYLTCMAGIRSMVEKGQGNIAKSGWLERKMTKALESLVVNQRRQVVNLRTGRIISPLIGDDGLYPYHIRGSDDEINKDGYTITLQPLKFEFTCKHGFHLEDSIPSGQCSQCRGTSSIETFLKELETKNEFTVSNATKQKIIDVLQHRDISIPNIRKLAKRLNAFYQDSICRSGEAIGSVAAQCIGEPATQAALRTFHFAGRKSFQGSVDRLTQLLEGPLTSDQKYTPITKLRLKENAKLEDAKKFQQFLTEVKGNKIIKLIEYDIDSMTLNLNFDIEAFKIYNLNPSIIFNQLQTVLETSASLFNAQILANHLTIDQPLSIRINSNDTSTLLFAKERILNANYNGLEEVTDVEILEPDENFNRYSLVINSSSNTLLKLISQDLNQYFDLSLIETTNHGWIYKNFGLEAALRNIYDELNEQMNLMDGSIGEYDMRYIRTITDFMGETGEIVGLGESGLSVKFNSSPLSASSLGYKRGITNAIASGSVMGNRDEIKGVTESIVVGNLPKIGDFAPN